MEKMKETLEEHRVVVITSSVRLYRGKYLYLFLHPVLAERIYGSSVNVGRRTTPNKVRYTRHGPEAVSRHPYRCFTLDDRTGPALTHLCLNILYIRKTKRVEC